MSFNLEEFHHILRSASDLTGASIGNNDQDHMDPRKLILDLMQCFPSLEEFLYRPDPVLVAKIEEYERLSLLSTKQKGQLMEEIAYLAFRCIAGFGSIQSYSSYSEQHDLVISGSSELWNKFLTYLHLPLDKRSIVVEAKFLNKKVTANQFTRLGYIIQNKFGGTCNLGVFLAHKSATGFDSNRVLRDARAAQILFHAKTGKYIVILDKKDILKLKEPGSLVRLLEAKVRDVEAAAEVDFQIHVDDQWIQIILPSHLSKYF